MGSKRPRRQVVRKTTIESLEGRQMFSAEPLGGLLGNVEQHTYSQPPVEQHAPPTSDSKPDFWYDANLKRDLDSLLGDVERNLATAHMLTGVSQAQNDYGFYGFGQTVAVIDSGIAWDHASLGGDFGSSYRVVGGWDFTEENDANPYDDGPSGSHGTHVAGIVGANSSNSSDLGVAPGVDFVGLRVFNDQGAGYFSWVEKALKWVHTNRNTFVNPITAVNLSLGTAWNAATVPSWAMLEDEFAQLAADGIFISVSAGNSFSSYNAAGLSYPAASSHVVPVMSVDDSGAMSYFSQRHTRAIAAPGRYIRSTVPDYVGNQNGVTDDWANYSGTSMASPYVAGASVIIREAMQFVGYTNISQDTIYNHMMSTADEFFDSATNQFYKRLNVSAALDALMPEDEFGSTAATTHQLGTVGADGTEVTGLIGKLNDVDFFIFTAGVAGTVNLSASGTHNLEPNITVIGSTATLENGTWSFDVVAGQSYTFSVATAAGHGLGYYDVDLTLDSIAQPAVIVKTLARSDGAIFSLDSDGWLSFNGMRAWANTYDFALSPADETLYWQSTYGLFQHRQLSGQWRDVDHNVVKFVISDAGMAYSLDANGWLSLNGKPVWGNTMDFALAADQTLYWQSTTGLLQQRLANGTWRDLDYNVSRFAVRDNGMVYSLGSDNITDINGLSVWRTTQDFVFTENQSLFWLSTYGLLQRLGTDGTWIDLDVNVSEFAVCHEGGAYALTSDGDVTINGVRAWSNIVDMRTDDTGCLLVEGANGTVHRISGRFELSSPRTSQGNSVGQMSTASSVGAGVQVQLFGTPTFNRAYEAAYSTLSTDTTFQVVRAALNASHDFVGGDVDPVLPFEPAVLGSTSWREQFPLEDNVELAEVADDLGAVTGLLANDADALAVMDAIDSLFEEIGEAP